MLSSYITTLLFLPMLAIASFPNESNGFTTSTTHSNPIQVKKAVVPPGGNYPPADPAPYASSPTKRPSPQTPYSSQTPAPKPTPTALPGRHKACTGANGQGKCYTYYEKPDSGCHNYPAEFWDQYSSIEMDPGKVLCLVYAMQDCYGDSFWLSPPGTKDLKEERFDNQMRSWNCWMLDP